MRPGTVAPRTDPLEYARKMAEAKQRAADLKARRSAGDSYQAPTFQARPVPMSTYSANNPPPGSAQYDAPAQPASQYSQQRLMHEPPVGGSSSAVGPYGPSSYSSAPPQTDRPAYRGMINYQQQAPQADAYGSSSYPVQQAMLHQQAPQHGGYNSGPAQEMHRVGNPVVAKEAEDTFYSMLRSDSGPTRNARGRKPEWSSDFAAGNDSYNAPAADVGGAQQLPKGPMSTKQKLAMMRDDLTGPTSASDPKISKEYSGIVQPSRNIRAADMPPADAYAPIQRSSGMGGGGGGGGMGGGGGGMGGGSDSFADAFPAKAGGALSRTGLKPSGRKPPQASGGGGGGGMAGPSGPAGAFSSYGNDDQPVGGGNRGPASYGNDDQPVGRGAASYGNDDQPVGGGNQGGMGGGPAARAPVAYGNDDQPVGASAGRGAARGGYGFDSGSFGPDDLPPGAQPSSGNRSPPIRKATARQAEPAQQGDAGMGSGATPGRSAAAMRARAHMTGGGGGGVQDQNVPPEYDYTGRMGGPGPGSARKEAPTGRSGMGGASWVDDQSSVGDGPSPPKPAGGKLALLKSKMRSTSAASSRSGDMGSQASGDEISPTNAGYVQQQAPGPRGAPPARPAQAGMPPRQPQAMARGNNNFSNNNNGYDSQEDEQDMARDFSPRGGRGGAGPGPVSGGAGGPMSETPDDDGGMDLVECRTCGRKFNEKALEKHERVCEKVFVAKRKAYDSKAHAIPDEAKQMAHKTSSRGGRKGAAKVEAKPVAAAADPEAPGNKTAWENKSNQLREAMRAARQYKAAVASGIDPKDIPMPTYSTPDPSLVPCPHCGRTFNEQAAERHIPKCTTMKAKPTILRKGAGVAAGAAGIKKMGAPMSAGSGGPSGDSYGSGYAASGSAGGSYGSGAGAHGSSAYASYDDMPVAGGGAGRASMGGAGARGAPARMSMGGLGGQRSSSGYGGGFGGNELPDLPDAPRGALMGRASSGRGSGLGAQAASGRPSAGGPGAGQLQRMPSGGGASWEDQPVGGGRASLAGGGGYASMPGRASMGGAGPSAGSSGSAAGGRPPRAGTVGMTASARPGGYR